MYRILLLFLFFPLLSIAQSKTLAAELVDYNEKAIPADCGYFIQNGILKFRITKNSDEFKKNQIIYAHFQCPRETMENNIGIAAYKNEQEYIITIGKNPLKDDDFKNAMEKQRVSKIYKNTGENITTLFPLQNVSSAE